jgi:hypothetical protein
MTYKPGDRVRVLKDRICTFGPNGKALKKGDIATVTEVEENGTLVIVGPGFPQYLAPHVVEPVDPPSLQGLWAIDHWAADSGWVLTSGDRRVHLKPDGAAVIITRIT